jgi:hypothetical protein
MLSGCAIGAGVMACADTAKDKANAAIPSDLIIPTSLEAPIARPARGTSVDSFNLTARSAQRLDIGQARAFSDQVASYPFIG